MSELTEQRNTLVRILRDTGRQLDTARARAIDPAVGMPTVRHHLRGVLSTLETAIAMAKDTE